VKVMTVQGPVAADTIGYALPHEHLLCDVTRPFWMPVDKERMGSDFYFEDEEVVLDNETVAIEELLYFKRAGGSMLVELTPICLSRNPQGLKRISEATGVHVVMGTGFYFDLHHSARVQTNNANELATEMVRDLTVGVEDTGIRAGIIGEIGSSRDYITPGEERVFRAAARAQLKTGAAVTTHAVHGKIGLAQLDLLEEEGVDLRRVIIGHCDLHRHLDYHLAIARRGATVEFDLVNSIPRQIYAHPKRAELVRYLIQLGYLRQILLSQDICHRAHLHTHGGGGYDYMINHFVPLLKDLGVSQEEIDIIMIENPRRILEF